MIFARIFAAETKKSSLNEQDLQDKILKILSSSGHKGSSGGGVSSSLPPQQGVEAPQKPKAVSQNPSIQRAIDNLLQNKQHQPPQHQPPQHQPPQHQPPQPSSSPSSSGIGLLQQYGNNMY